MTPAERKALAFFAAVAAVGAGARAAGVGADPMPVTVDDPAAEARLALDRQIAAVDSARAHRPARRGGRRRRAGADDTVATGADAVLGIAGRRGRRRGRPEAGPEAPGGAGWTAAAWTGAAPSQASPASAPPVPLDVERADSAALERLPGVGPALARRIVADRAARGAFGSMDGLSRVAGVGPRLEARLRPLVTFAGRPP